MTDTKRKLSGLVAAAVATSAVVLAGCGSGSSNNASSNQPSKSDDTAAVKQVMTTLQTASQQGDGNRICTQIFTPKLADSVTISAKSGSCAKEVNRELFSRNARITVENVDVSNSANVTATVKEANGNVSNIFLVKQSGRWRIRSVQGA
ncbi:MAG: hypothetical protein ACJ780_16030 [Solirubrobacteraceae bacterium]